MEHDAGLRNELASAECPACLHLWAEPGGEGSKIGQRCCLCRPTQMESLVPRSSGRMSAALDAP